MYIDPTISLWPKFFFEFTNVANTSYRIIQDWVIDVNDGTKYLAFQIIKQSHIIHCVDFLISIHSVVTWEGFNQVITFMKTQCIISYDLLVIELMRRFLNHELMNVLGIIYP
jgi:hypothetical protein